MNSHHLRLLPAMWAIMGVALFATLTTALLALDSAATGYIAGGLLGACLLVCVVAYWSDSRFQRGVEKVRQAEHVSDLTAAP